MLSYIHAYTHKQLDDILSKSKNPNCENSFCFKPCLFTHVCQFFCSVSKAAQAGMSFIILGGVYFKWGYLLPLAYQQPFAHFTRQGLGCLQLTMHVYMFALGFSRHACHALDLSLYDVPPGLNSPQNIYNKQRQNHT